MTAEDREALAGLLEANGIPAELLMILEDGAPEKSGSFARLEGGRVVALHLDAVDRAETIQGLAALRELRLAGGLRSFTLAGASSLETLILRTPERTLEHLELSDLPSLELLEVDGGAFMESPRLKGLTALRSLGFLNCGLRQVPALGGSPLTSLNLSGNQIRDFGPLREIPTLVSLLLPSNGLTTLETLPPLPALRALRLGHNPLTPEISLTAKDFPNLKTLDLRFTGLEKIPAGLQGLPVKWDESQSNRIDFLKTLESLRAAHKTAPGDLVETLGSSHGIIEDSRGDCRWRTGSFHRAEVRCRLEIGSLKGLAAARLGTTDLALPFQGGGSPHLRAELRVGEGNAAVYVRKSFDLVATARQLSGVDEATAEEARQPGDRFEGYRRLVARPGAPAVLEGEPSLLGSRVVLWLEADGEARSVTLTIEPS